MKDSIITHPSILKNKLIVETPQNLKYVQRTGQGVDIIFKDMVSMGKFYPRYRSFNDAASLTYLVQWIIRNLLNFLLKYRIKIAKLCF